MRVLIAAGALAGALSAQQALTLRDAVDQALRAHPAIVAAGEQTRAAEARIAQAKAGYLPRVAYAESYARSDNPVFVFSSLLTQHQFTEQNFDIGALNRPDFLNNFQSLATVDQTVWDGGAARLRVKAAQLGQTSSAEDERRARLQATSRVIETYFGIQLAKANLAAAREAVRSAEADLERAQTVRQAGMSTDAEVLSIRVHLASVREQEIRRAAELDVARAALNEALGAPLDTPRELLTELQPVAVPAAAAADFESRAMDARPEIKQTRIGKEVAETQRSLARSALMPQVGVRGAFEADCQQFVRKGGANWLVAATLRWNLFDGGADRARVAEASHALAAADAQERRAEAAVRLDVRRAWSMLQAANERVKVATAAVDMAEESLRITKNRYEAGMTTVTELLRNETAVADARTRRSGAIYDQRLSAAALELASGTLTADSEVLR